MDGSAGVGAALPASDPLAGPGDIEPSDKGGSSLSGESSVRGGASPVPKVATSLLLCSRRRGTAGTGALDGIYGVRRYG